MYRHYTFASTLLLSIMFLYGCSPRLNTQMPSADLTGTSLIATLTPTVSTSVPSTATLFPTSTFTWQNHENEKVWLPQSVPNALRTEIENGELEFSDTREEATIELVIGNPYGNGGEKIYDITWIYCLVAPFPTIMDGITYHELLGIWMGQEENPYAEIPLLVSSSTKAAFDQKWGESTGSQVVVVDDAEILQMAWENSPSFAIIPFEDLEPRWKVLSVSGVSPLEKGLDARQYPLSIQFSLIRPNEYAGGDSLSGAIESLPRINRDENKMTVLMMTGTTALVRYTALRMEEYGINYPAQSIGTLLASADITHISNEVPFYDRCPAAEPVRLEQRFCSDPSYFQLLETIGADVIELTGNHILDWGYEPFLDTLDMYDEAGLVYYGGGRNLEEAQEPLVIEHNGNRLVFMGCSPAGPENVFATNTTPGSATCDFDNMQAEIENYLQDGYIPIVTFQHFEAEQFQPHSSQRIDFQAASRMGAKIVSGSQSHFPQTMTFIDGNFIHYGLGNLFFDQMYGYNPHEFIDEHIIYDGKYINTILITAMLEDYSQPRLMNIEERKNFLEDIFDACVWE